MRQFDRQYRFIAPGLEIGAMSSGQPMATRVNFLVEKAETESPNSARISLWNLNPEQLAILNTPDCMIMLRAGYKDMMPLIFVGTVVFVSTRLDGADRETEIEAVDGRVCIRDTYVSLSYAGKINSKKIISDTAMEMGVVVSFSYNAQFYDFPYGFSFVGAARSILDKACASSGLQWHIQNGILQIKNRNDTMNRKAFVLSPDSGLLHIPKKIMLGPESNMVDSQGSSDEERPGYEVEYFMNGAINVSDYVRLESEKVMGYFRLESVELRGDNIQGDWVCRATLIEVSPS